MSATPPAAVTVSVAGSAPGPRAGAAGLGDSRPTASPAVNASPRGTPGA